MTIPAVLLPLFVEVGVTFLLLFWAGSLRVSAVRSGAVRQADVSMGQPAWPARPTLGINAYHNQFELPVLFYILVVLALFTRKADLLFVVLSWVFVISRIVHAGIHVTVNDMRPRFGAFLLGALVLVVMWIIFALRILLAAPLL